MTRRLPALVLMAAVALTMVSCSSDESGDGDRVHSKSGLSVVVPNGWNLSGKSDPQALAGYVGPSPNIDENCKAAQESVAAVRFQVFNSSEAQKYVEHPAARRKEFTSKSGSGVITGGVDQPCGSSSQDILITENHRKVDAYLTFGARVSKSERANAYAFLNSLEVGPPPRDAVPAPS